MAASYETVIDPATVVWTMTAVGVHAAVVALQLALLLYLVGSGALLLVAPGLDRPWLRKLGAMEGADPGLRPAAAARIVLGIAIGLPVLVGAPMLVSLVAFVGAHGLLIAYERSLRRDAGRSGRLARRAAIAATLLVATFAIWEGEDGLALGVEIGTTAQSWRTHELEWQLANDLEAPKVGDLAPDFELQTPDGRTAVRLSEFRGKRPVALAFGSYT